MAMKTYAAGLGQAVDDMQINVKSLLITAAAADATVTLKGEGNTQVVLAAKAGTSVSWPSGLNGGSSVPVVGPVTIDVTGVGAFARIDF